MMFICKALLVAALIGFAASAPTQNVIIGYRTVSKAQAEVYSKAKTVVWSDPKGGQQLGAGVYLTPNLGGWPGIVGDWYCVVFAKQPAFDKISKAWIPEYNECEDKVWFSRANEINEEITSLGGNPETTVRLSTVFGKRYQHIKQIVLPRALLDYKTGTGKKVSPLGISVVCDESMNALPDVSADIASWPNTLGIAQ